MGESGTEHVKDNHGERRYENRVTGRYCRPGTGLHGACEEEAVGDGDATRQACGVRFLLDKQGPINGEGGEVRVAPSSGRPSSPTTSRRGSTHT